MWKYSLIFYVLFSYVYKLFISGERLQYIINRRMFYAKKSEIYEEYIVVATLKKIRYLL